MAKPHKYAGRSMEVASALSAEKLADLCKEAADQSKLRLDAARPGELIFSIRAALSSKRRLMSIAVRLSADGDKQVMQTRITDYRTLQHKTYLLFVIPVPTGPRNWWASRPTRSSCTALASWYSTSIPKPTSASQCRGIIMAILGTLFWICLVAFVAWRLWARFHEPPPFDPDNPPDLRSFAPPPGSDGGESSESENRKR